MDDPLIITTEEDPKAENYTEQPIIETQQKYLVTPQLLIDIRKREDGIVIKMKKTFKKQD